ncbi:Sulfatase [uncultured Sporomusa sp.]|uniref:Sulfatase n=1 Tax=uncultured Sporomusa sp. TaxID=307249 RepID=A0A212M1D9_9FIRM|nr:alkaline phosphatase family protein [uncultured Sporomusa sp.]SCM83634.1 Sulfatase [uncultured Sporomusa sp.]
MSRWEIFFRNIQQDLKLFLFVLGLLCILRIAFIGGLSSYLSAQSATTDIIISLFYGLRMSLKSAGVVTLFSFLFCTLISVVVHTRKIEKIRFWLGNIYISLLILLFHARIPFYQEFHTGFNQMIFNTFRDDITALFYTLVADYNLPVFLITTAIISYIFCRLLRKLLASGTYLTPQFPQVYQKVLFRLTVAAAVCFFMIFIRFGGSLTYAHSLHWENAAVSRDDFLNEAIIDDIQALYRAYSIQKRVGEGSGGIKIDAERIRSYGGLLKDSIFTTNQIDDVFAKQAEGPKIPKPRHIFIILGESYAQWPLLEPYGGLHIADGIKGIISQDNAAHISAFVPNGAFTPMAVTAVVSGLSDVGVFPNYHPESYKEPYSTAIAPQFKKLGYKLNFWYGGAKSWERIKDFALAQGFDNFYGMGDFPSKSGNVWGSDDRYLFEGIVSSFTSDVPTLTVILTVSNHAPYSVDLAREGFDEAQTIAALPEEARNDKELLKRLGHYWYTDRQISEFVLEIHNKYPDSLFVITGDHADRTNISKTPTTFDRYTVPLVLYGAGINKDLIPASVAGSHINIAPTLIELIAPKGFVYYSEGKSLTRGSDIGFSHNVWITPDAVGKIQANNSETFDGSLQASVKPESVHQKIDVMRALAWWRIEKGKIVE